MLRIEIVKSGRPLSSETRGSNTACRMGHPLTGRNVFTACRPCCNIRAAETMRRKRARLAGAPITDPLPLVVCDHDRTDPANNIIKCRECRNMSKRAEDKRKAMKSKAASATQSEK